MEEEKIYKDIELRSEEVQEVMNHISPWVVRCGITVLAVILLMVLVGCWIFRSLLLQFNLCLLMGDDFGQYIFHCFIY